MTKRTSTPYPRLRIELMQAEEDKENKDDHTSRYCRQLGIIVPKPQKGREAFVEILNKEWELRGAELFPVSTKPNTLDADSQDGDDDEDNSWRSPSLIHPLPPLLAQSAATSSALGNAELEDQMRGLRGMADRLGLSMDDVSVVATYANRPVEEAHPSLALGWTGAIDADTELRYTHFADEHGGLVYPQDYQVEPQSDEANMETLELVETIVPLDLDLVFRFEGGVLYVEFPAV